METEGYTIQRIDGCFIVKNAIPVTKCLVLMNEWKEQGADTADCLIAEKLGASMVCGSIDNLNKLRSKLGIKLIPGGK